MGAGNCKAPMVLAEDEVKQVWRNADAVCFDVDSTVCTDEAIDEFAKFLGVEEEVSRLTESAMAGGMTMKESMSQTFNHVKATQSQLLDFVEMRAPSLTPGIRDLVAELQRNEVPVYLISGGFERVIRQVARTLGISEENMITNKLMFDADGNSMGYDPTRPTCESGGKAIVVGNLKEKYGYKNLVMIGDGVTDMEACPPADAFIGFGGNQVRDQVKSGSSWYVYSFEALLTEYVRLR